MKLRRDPTKRFRVSSFYVPPEWRTTFPIFDAPLETTIEEERNPAGAVRFVLYYRSSECPAGGPGAWNTWGSFRRRRTARRRGRQLEAADAWARWAPIEKEEG